MIFVHFFPFIVLQEIVSYITLLWWKSRHNYLQIQVIHCINDTQSSKHIYRSGNVSRINISNIAWIVLLFPVQTIHVGRGMVKFANMLQLLFLYFLISHINFFIRKNVKNFSNLSNTIVEIRLGIFMFRNDFATRNYLSRDKNRVILSIPGRTVHTISCWPALMLYSWGNDPLIPWESLHRRNSRIARAASICGND